MRVLLILVFLVIQATTAGAERRAAFVVGNSSYLHSASLANPASDAVLMSETLRSLGFNVSAHNDLTRAGFAEALGEFVEENADADLTVFYFAGHGMQFQSENFLLGVDAKLRTELDIEGEAISLDTVVRLLERNSKAVLAFIDACRNNPLSEDFYRNNFSETRALATRGLAPITRTYEGSMMVFAASPGQVAYDGSGRNSPFAESLSRHLATSNLEVLSLMKRVIGDVKDATDNLQVPIVTNDLTREIYLASAAPDEPIVPELAADVRAFQVASKVRTARAWDLFIERYPSSELADEARRARDEIEVASLVVADDREISDSELLTSRSSAPAILRDIAFERERENGLNRENYRVVQQRLNELGFDAGPADGLPGPRTREAIMDFQLSKGLAPSGVVTQATASKLGLATRGLTVLSAHPYSNSIATYHSPDELRALETDPRLLSVATTLAPFEYIYGFFEGRIYIALLTHRTMSTAHALQLADDIGGHLATVTSPEENEFVLSLVEEEPRIWRNQKNGQGVVGPVIGFMREKGDRTEGGGWYWPTGEAVDYTNWRKGQPNNWFDNGNEETIALYKRHAWMMNEGNYATVNDIPPLWNDVGDATEGRGIIFEID